MREKTVLTLLGINDIYDYMRERTAGLRGICYGFSYSVNPSGPRCSSYCISVDLQSGSFFMECYYGNGNPDIWELHFTRDQIVSFDDTWNPRHLEAMAYVVTWWERKYKPLINKKLEKYERKEKASKEIMLKLSA